MLKVQNLNVTYKTKRKKVQAVRNVTFEIEKQDSLGIVGESGSGKSTLAMAVLRLLPKRITEVEGEVQLNGVDLLQLEENKLADMRWKEIAAVFQKSMNALSPVHKVGLQLSDIYRVHDASLPKTEVKRKIVSLLKTVNLPERVYDLYPHELSGGMMQRVSIALSLMHSPALLILDEATTALDSVTQGQILEEIKELEKQFELTRVMITHDLSVVASSCRKVAVMYAGSLMEFGPREDVLNNPIHPYTQGLLKSIPSFDGEKQNIRGISGTIPDLNKEVQGCVFAARCEYAMDKCRAVEPAEYSINDRHWAACYLAEGDDDDD